MLNMKGLVKRIQFEVREHEKYSNWFIAMICAIGLFMVIVVIKGQVIHLPDNRSTYSYQLNPVANQAVNIDKIQESIELQYYGKRWVLKNQEHQILSSFHGIYWSEELRPKAYRFYYPRLVNIEKELNRGLKGHEAIVIMGNIPPSQLNLKSNPLEHLLVIKFEHDKSNFINIKAQKYLSYEDGQGFDSSGKISRVIARPTPFGRELYFNYDGRQNKRSLGSITQ